jgi:hypothetical protein
MPITRTRIAALLLFLALFATSASASAAPLASDTHTIVHEKVTWTLPANQCASLPVGISVSGTGERIAVTNTTINADGSSQIVSNDLVIGTAVGSDGSTYRFVYHNHTAQNLPNGSGPIDIHMVDSFMLKGHGRARDVNTGFNWRWTYIPPAESWPPVDNWQKISTRGDSFTCDPI